MKPVAILGSGPAGLLAALAVGLRGRPMVIFSNKEKSQLGGAQYLHRRIPIVADREPDAVLMNRKVGTSEVYRQKVYGDDPVPFVSFDGVDDGMMEQAWNLIDTYENLWGEFGHAINEADVGPRWIEEHRDEFSAILSTVPLPALCRARAGLTPEFHSFKVQEIVISTDPDYCSVPRGEDNTIIYDGTRERSHYRSSRLFGVSSTEWSTIGGSLPPIPDLIRDRKPVATTCDCFSGEVIRLGRRGTWRKGVLTHHAFEAAWEVFG